MSYQYLLLLLLSLGVSAVEVQRPRGVPLSKRQFYEEGKPFTCLDGSRTIPFDRVNDDYCDCEDGSDEPGTAACPNGSFHCTNAGFRPAFIPSSRINDGICDCCDTTDEYNSGAACQNTCRELGSKEREIMKEMAEIAKEGFLLKQQLIQEAKSGLEEKKAKLAEVQVSKKDLEDKLEALRTVKETAEQPEKEAKERHLKAWEGKLKFESLSTFTIIISNADIPAPVETPQEETREPVPENDSEQYPEEDIPEEEEDDDEEDEDEDPDDGDYKVSPVRISIRFMKDDHEFLFNLDLHFVCRNLEKEISFDFGPGAEFAYLYGQCYELSTSEYIYRLCPFNRVSQKPKYGGSETNLGSWGKWTGPEDNVYSLMKYEHGTGCWQGPNRSTTVKLTCGKETVVLSTSEPSRCEYLMEFTTPAVCQEPQSLYPDAHDHTEL
uniref:Glucosidase 2 subunit beta n=1 Tax=Sparus aurata TaxID=8175 RepID=A0A671V3C0_SPAAU